MSFTTTARTALALLTVTTTCLSTALPAHSAATQDKKTITLGDLDPKVDAQSVGAPFDPCAVGWESMPAEVRSTTNSKPKLRAPKKTDAFAVGCRYDNSEGDEVTTKPGTGPTVGKNFFVLIVWSKPGQMSAAQSNHQGAQPAQFGAKAGLLIAGTNNASKEASCTAILSLANGAAGVAITNGRFPQIDTCVVAKSIATAIAEKTP